MQKPDDSVASYGAQIITDVCNSPGCGLFISQRMRLDEVRTEVANGKKFPTPTNVRKENADDFLYSIRFLPADFAAIYLRTAKFEAHARLTAASVFGTPAGIPAWKTKPSGTWSRSRPIRSDLERRLQKARPHHTRRNVRLRAIRLRSTS